MPARKKAKIVHQHSEFRSNYLPEDIWTKIFKKLDQNCLYETAYCVCRQWRSVCRLLLFWYQNTRLINLSRLGTNEFHHLVVLLERTLDQLQQRLPSPLFIRAVLFPQDVEISDDQLLYLVKRLPGLQSLNLGGALKTVTKTGFSKALCYLNEILNLSIGSLSPSNYTYFIQQAAINCKNLQELSIYTTADLKSGNMFVLDEHSSLVIANNLPQLKQFLFRRLVIYKSGLSNIMTKCTRLESFGALWCKHAHTRATPKFHRVLKRDKSYHVDKETTEDNVVEWVMFIRCVRMSFTSASSVLSYLWSFEANGSRALLERLRR